MLYIQRFYNVHCMLLSLHHWLTNELTNSSAVLLANTSYMYICREEIFFVTSNLVVLSCRYYILGLIEPRFYW